jgi:hypothetical protein
VCVCVWQRGGPRVCVAVCAIGRSRALAEGITWTSRTLQAPWAARESHTSVVDAAGAIYVIGGWDGLSTVYKDVWVSTDGGADRTGWSGGTGWVLRGTK